MTLGALKVDELILPVTSVRLAHGCLLIEASVRIDRPRRVAVLGQPYEVFGEDGLLVMSGFMRHGVPVAVEPEPGDWITLVVRSDITTDMTP